MFKGFFLFPDDFTIDDNSSDSLNLPGAGAGAGAGAGPATRTSGRKLRTREQPKFLDDFVPQSSDREMRKREKKTAAAAKAKSTKS